MTIRLIFPWLLFLVIGKLPMIFQWLFISTHKGNVTMTFSADTMIISLAKGN